MIGSWRVPTTVMPETKRVVMREDLVVAAAGAADGVAAIAIRSAIPVPRPLVVAHNRVVVLIRAAVHNLDAAPAIAAATIRAETASAVGPLSSPNSKAVVRVASVAA